MNIQLPKELEPQTSLGIDIKQNSNSILHENDDEQHQQLPHIPSLLERNTNNIFNINNNNGNHHNEDENEDMIMNI